MKRISIVLAAILLASLSSASFAASKSERKPKEKLDSIHERIESLKKELNTTKEAHADAADALKKSEKAISESNRKLFELRQEQNKHNQRLDLLQSQKSNLETTIEGQKRLLAQQLYQQYLHGRESYLQIILQEKDPSAAARQVQYFGYVSKARSQLIASTKSNLNQVAKLNEETSQALKEVVTLKGKQEAEIAKLKGGPESKAAQDRIRKIQEKEQFIADNSNTLLGILAMYKKIVELKLIIISKLQQIESIGTFIKTESGYKVSKPEGFVAIGHDGGAVKLVDRIEFSRENFNATKQWKQR